METPERAGWFDDPDDPEQLRYFDGIVWSDRRVPKKAPARAPEPPPESAQAGERGRGSSVLPAPGRTGPPPLTWRHEAGHAPPTGQPGRPVAGDGRPLAGAALRLVSGIVDLLVVGVLSAVVSGWAWYRWMADYWRFVLDKAQAGNTRAVEGMSPEELLGFFDMRWFAAALGLTILVGTVYHLVMLALRGQTLGKIATGTIVRAVGATGDSGLGWSVAARRVGVVALLWVLVGMPLVSWIAFPLLVASQLWALGDRRQQGWHDKIAGTEVVRRGELRRPGPG